jgi:hypothetical protein
MVTLFCIGTGRWYGVQMDMDVCLAVFVMSAISRVHCAANAWEFWARPCLDVWRCEKKFEVVWTFRLAAVTCCNAVHCAADAHTQMHGCCTLPLLAIRSGALVAMLIGYVCVCCCCCCCLCGAAGSS